MKICTRCNTNFEGDFCPTCGVKANLSNQPTSQPPSQQPSNFIPPPPINHKKPHKPFYFAWWFYLIISVVVVAIIGIIFVNGRRHPNVWPTVILKDIIPEPPSKNSELHTNSDEKLWIDINKVSDVQYTQYLSACISKGFTLDAEKDSNSYEAYNTDGYSLRLSHFGKELSIHLEAPMKLGSIIWPTSTVGKMLPVPKSTVGKFSFENENNFFVYVGETSKEDFQQYISACTDKGFTMDYDKGETFYYADNAEGYHLSLRYKGNRVMTVEISSPKDATEKNNQGDKTSSSVDKKSEETTAPAESTVSEKETTETSASEKPAPETSASEKPTTGKTTSSSASATNQTTESGLRKDFKEAMDSYEAFMDEYVAFMKKYESNPSDIKLLTDYAKFMSTYGDWVVKFEKWQSDDLNEAETTYYLEVQTRVNAKLLEVVQN